MSDFDQILRKTEITLKKRVTALVEDAQAERLSGNLSKTLGLASLGLGGLAAITTGGLATIPISIGAVAYLAVVVGQARKTGRVMPIPFVDSGATELIGGVAGARVELPDLDDYSYMTTQQKAEYAMILCCTNRLSRALAQLPSDEHRQFAYAVAKRRFMQLYGQHIRETPELLMSVDAGELAEYLLASEDDFKALRQSTQQEALPTYQEEEMPAVEPQKALVGANTRLGAVDVPAAASLPSMPVEGDPWGTEEVSTPNHAVTALETMLASPYASRAIFGSQRCGKSLLASVASQKLTETKGTVVFHINLSSFGTEDDAYWQHVKRSVRCDLTTLNSHQAQKYISDAVSLVNEWWGTKNAILITDEWGHLASVNNTYSSELEILLKLIADKISCISSTGIKRQQALWTISPEFVAGSMTANGKAIKKLPLCLLAIPKGRSVDWNGDAITWNPELYSQIERNYAIKPFELTSAVAGADRVAFINGSWLPVGVDDSGVKFDTQQEPQQTQSQIIHEHLKKTSEAKSVGRIKADIWALKEVHSEIVEALLEELVNAGLVTKETTERGIKYKAL